MVKVITVVDPREMTGVHTITVSNHNADRVKTLRGVMGIARTGVSSGKKTAIVVNITQKVHAAGGQTMTVATMTARRDARVVAKTLQTWTVTSSAVLPAWADGVRTVSGNTTAALTKTTTIAG